MNLQMMRVIMRPGLYLKRWLLMFLFGAIMAFWGLHRIKGEMAKHHLKLNIQLMMIFFGACLCLFGLYKFISTALKYAGFTRRAFWDNLMDRGYLARGPRVVAIGGGTGLSTLLAGIKPYTSNITACVTVTDEGGSSGRLREAFGMQAPGDIRNCIVALSTAPVLLSELFNYRFQEGEAGLKGHSLGNLFIAALTRITGSFELAVEESCRVLSIRGRVFPLTRDNIRIVAELNDGRELRGEIEIAQADKPIRKLWLDPPAFTVTPEVLEAIREADLVLVGPGSLYTSILPNLLPQPCWKALAETRAPVVFVCNVMTEPGETDQFTAADHVRVIYDHASGTEKIFDWIVVNTQPVPRGYVDKYRQEGAVPVKVDIDELRRMGLRVLAGDFLKGDVPVMTAEGEKHVLRHDVERLAEKLMPLCRR